MRESGYVKLEAKKNILIVDFGSQTTKLIARRVREACVFSLVVSPDKVSASSINKDETIGIILSGSDQSVEINKINFDEKIFDLDIPILGICYGYHLTAKHFGGEIKKGKTSEFGASKVQIFEDSAIFKNLNSIQNVWMSHRDQVLNVGNALRVTSKNDTGMITSFEHKSKNIFGVQFHPEVVHTPNGNKIIENFIFKVCKASKNWTDNIIEEEILTYIKTVSKEDKVLIALSGGVDSTVAAVLCQKAIPGKCVGLAVDTGLMRKNEISNVHIYLKNELNIPVKVVDAHEIFIERLKNVTDPEEKRKIIGKTFIDVFEKAVKEEQIKHLVQGTIYPDIIESTKIKSHHNVGGLPKDLKLTIIEPLRNLFKDEVRMVGKKLKIKDEILNRHPFPGPGLGIRIIGDITKDRLETLKNIDELYINFLHEKNLYDKIWQAFAVLLPIKTVGVKGDERSYDNVVALRAVTSVDGMTAKPFNFDSEILEELSTLICNKVPHVNRVVYDVTSKPPATIEWE